MELIIWFRISDELIKMDPLVISEIEIRITEKSLFSLQSCVA